MSQEAGEHERQRLPEGLNLGQVVPPFELSDVKGRTVKLWDYKGRRNLVIFFFHSSNCAACRDALTAFALHYSSYRELDSEVVAITRDAAPVVRALAEGLRLPFPVLSDVGGEATRRYLKVPSDASLPTTAIFVTDRYGALYHQVLAEQDADLPIQEEVLSWLQFIGIQCEECFMPEWPVDQ